MTAHERLRNEIFALPLFDEIPASQRSFWCMHVLRVDQGITGLSRLGGASTCFHCCAYIKHRSAGG